MRSLRSALAIVAFCGGFASAVAIAQENYFADKRVTITVGFAPGGGVDANARLLAGHIGRYIPGNPTVIVQNLPGAGGLTAVISLDTSAPKDGTAMVGFNPAQVVQSITNPEEVKVDFSKMNWLGSIDKDIRVCYMWAATGVKTWDDMLKRNEVIMGASGTGATSIEQKMLQKIFGVKLKQVNGYTGSAERHLAVERGELEGDCEIWTSIPAEWIRDKKIIPVLRFQDETAKDLPASVPYGGTLLKDPNQKHLLELLTAGSEIGRPYILSGSVPADRLKILRDAFDKAVKDPQFAADAEKRGLGVSPTPGAKLQELVKELYATPTSVVAAAKEILKD